MLKISNRFRTRIQPPNTFHRKNKEKLLLTLFGIVVHFLEILERIDVDVLVRLVSGINSHY